MRHRERGVALSGHETRFSRVAVARVAARVAARTRLMVAARPRLMVAVWARLMVAVRANEAVQHLHCHSP